MKQTISFGTLLLFFFRQLGFLNLDVIKVCQPFERFVIGVVLMLHQKTNRTSSFATTKALKYSLDRIDIERRCLFVMKRTQADVIHSPFLQRNKRPYDIFYLYGVHYLGDIFSFNHLSAFVWAKVVKKDGKATIFAA